VSGEFLVDGVGALTREVRFPVSFIEKPLLSYGGNIESTPSNDIQDLPTISVIVMSYIEDRSGIGGRVIYRGANLGVVVTGQTNQKMWIHWKFDAEALVNPVVHPVSTEDAI
jgi:hypothetical protein